MSAKGAQLGLTRSWARELGPWGITVNSVSPGWIPTERHADIPDHVKEEYALRTPLGRLGLPEEVGKTVVFLASDAGAFITGHAHLYELNRVFEKLMNRSSEIKTAIVP